MAATLRLVDVNRNDVFAGLRELDGERKPDVSKSDDSDRHFQKLLLLSIRGVVMR